MISYEESDATFWTELTTEWRETDYFYDMCSEDETLIPADIKHYDSSEDKQHIIPLTETLPRRYLQKWHTK